MSQPRRGAGEVIGRAFQHAQGVMGHLALSLETRKPVNRGVVLGWIARLRRAADELEELVK